MARAPNENIDKAYELFKDGCKLVEIASQLNVPPGTVRRWKSTYKWDNERSVKNSERSENKKSVQKSVQKKEVKAEKQVMKNDSLTEKQKLFCIYYNRSFNATQSYLKAFGCSYNVANAEGYKLLVNPCVREEVTRLKEIKRQSIMISEDDIVEKYMQIAFSDMNDFVTVSGVCVSVKNSDDVDGSLITEISQGLNGIKIKLEDRQKALEWLSKYFMLDPMDKHKIEYDKLKYELDKKKISDDDLKTINIIHNIPRPPKEEGEE